MSVSIELLNDLVGLYVVPVKIYKSLVELPVCLNVGDYRHEGVGFKCLVVGAVVGAETCARSGLQALGLEY